MTAACDPDVMALRHLVGGSVARRREIAAVIGCNEQTLYQIVRGIPLQSGRLRGVGRALREQLDRHFPGWRISFRAQQAVVDVQQQPPEACHSLRLEPDEAAWVKQWCNPQTDRCRLYRAPLERRQRRGG
jgi:hypothetical protein